MNQKFLTKTVENGIASKVYRILLVIWDVICINGCSFLALFMRYDMNWDKFINSHTVRAGEYVQTLADIMVVNRSEERRVGKECRSRWSPYH